MACSRFILIPFAQVKLLHPHVNHYSDAVALIWGRFGYELTGVMFALFLILIVVISIVVLDSPGCFLGRSRRLGVVLGTSCLIRAMVARGR